MSGTAEQDGGPVVRWEELKPEEFHRRLGRGSGAQAVVGQLRLGVRLNQRAS